MSLSGVRLWPPNNLLWWIKFVTHWLTKKLSCPPLCKLVHILPLAQLHFSLQHHFLLNANDVMMGGWNYAVPHVSPHVAPCLSSKSKLKRICWSYANTFSSQNPSMQMFCNGEPFDTLSFLYCTAEHLASISDAHSPATPKAISDLHDCGIGASLIIWNCKD